MGRVGAIYRDTKRGVFDEYYHRIIETVMLNVQLFCRENCFEQVNFGQELRSVLQEQFMRITLRTLIVEMKLSEQCGELNGDSDEALYQDFIKNYVSNDSWLEQFYQNYPLLHRYVLETIQKTTTDICETIQRFYQDKDELKEYIGKANYIVCINGGSSDVHQGGKRVYILELDDGGKIVYKSRSLLVDQKFLNFVQWISESIDITYIWGWILDKEKYGWCEWIEGASCEKMEQLQQYYIRNGILLAVSYLLGTSDIHYENLIAHGEYPIIIDLEMALGKRAVGESKDISAAERICRDSVLRTGLLPMFAWNQEGEGVNVGAINAGGGQLVPIELPCVKNPGSVNMKIEYHRPTVKEGKNLAKLENQFIEPYVFINQIEFGFERVYRFIMENKTEVRKKIERMKDLSLRYLAKNTQEYTMILGASYHPSCIYDEKKRRKVLGHIRRQDEADQKQIWIAEQEIDELEQGDIPYFYYKAGKLALHSGPGNRYENFFNKSVINEIMERLERLDEINMSHQKRLIRASLTIGSHLRQGSESNKIRSTDLHTQKIGGQMGVEVAKNIADVLLKEAIWDEDKRTVNWISMMLAGYRERGCLIRSMGPYLYDGIAGVALFFAELYHEVPEKEYITVKEALVRQLFEHTRKFAMDEKKEKRSVGAFTGEASIAYVYQQLYVLEKDERYLYYMKMQCDSLASVCEYDHVYDILGGNAGAIMVFLNAYKMTRETGYLEYAIQAGDHLLKNAMVDSRGMSWVNPGAGVALTGFAHGTSGIMLALSKLGEYSGKKRFIEAAYQAYCFEQSYYESDVEDWTDLRYSEEQRKLLSHELAWCHGKGGILMARSEMEENLNDKGVVVNELICAEGKVKVKVGSGKIRDYNLCHGKLGEAAILYILGRREMGEELFQKIVAELGQAQGEIRDLLGQQECENYGFMSGICGLGYACLGNVEKVANIVRIATASEP